jgi:AcrR family transcriptional regulator
MAEKNEPDLVLLAFELVAERGWHRLSFGDLARRADAPLAKVYALLPDRAALLPALGRRLDAQMLGLPLAELDGMTPRERVFELVMRRFDAMAPYKPGLRVLARAAPCEPGLVCAAACNLDRLGRWLLDAAGTTDGRLLDAVARRLLAAIYVRAFHVWLDDDSPDLARTLAELDRRLQQAESLAGWVRGLRRGRGEPAGATAAS